MNKISCDICMDLMPLVKDEVASDDSKKVVYEHMKFCEDCKNVYGVEVVFEDSDKKILKDIKKNLTHICLIIIGLGMLFGISLSANQFMFYNILIMPAIGGISYFSLKKKSIYVCTAVFITVYLRWLYDSFGYALNGNLVQAFIPPLWWALIYTGLTLFGILVAMLLHFGFKKEKKDEKDN
ncbi:MAG: zf-HC2 domain-containing protein [Eubacteriales bacterium]|uniref:zf-HC2 domain-containing protein n=1 Tax=Tannockella kyphosi TaxID=2899121 RepID=UPI0020127023|nr:zf-HC2 domain-containing protein [Tannockella kyphosi]